MSYDEPRDEISSHNAADRFGSAGRSPRNFAGSDRTLAAALDELEIEVAEVAAGTARGANLPALEADARDVWRHARTQSERDRAEILVGRVTRLAQRTTGGAAPTASATGVIHPEAALTATSSSQFVPSSQLASPQLASSQFTQPQPITPVLPSGLIALAQFLSPPPAGPVVTTLPPPGAPMSSYHRPLALPCRLTHRRAW